MTRYDLDPHEIVQPSEKIIEMIAEKKRMLLKGSQPDLKKAAITIIQDYRHQKIGMISLEKPNDK